MGKFTVKPDDLRSLANKLGNVESRLRDASDKIDNEAKSAAGQEDLADALGHFEDEWDYSLGKLGEHASAVQENLNKSADLYQETDEEIATSATGEA